MMEVVWIGHSCFRLRGREAVVVTDPFQKMPGYTLGRLTADIVTVSHRHAGHDNAAAVGGNPRVVAGPGEYEIKGVFITGVQTAHDAEGGKKRGRNTAYLVEMEDLVVCHLGDLGHALTTEQVEAMSKVAVLLIPVGAGSTIGASTAAEVISLIEPKIVVPMHYRVDGVTSHLDPVDKFCRELGVKQADAIPKLSVAPSSLPEEVQVVILEPRGLKGSAGD
ncbi:MAG: MBL fold metallo-hydrolase [Chloroflexi bacterium]|nr:MBL fold metallo-hydrolase [Chloroflexota bacterium]